MNISDKIKNIHELRKQLQTAEIEFQYNSIIEFQLTCTAHVVPFENMIENGYVNMRTYYSGNSDNNELPYLISFGFLPNVNK